MSIDQSVTNIRTMLRDAIVEYIANREDGNVDAYMASRYPNLFGAALDQKKQHVSSAIYHAKKSLDHIDSIATFVATKFDEDYNRAIEAHEAAHRAVDPTQTPRGLMFFDDIAPSEREIEIMRMVSRALSGKTDVMRKVAEANNMPVMEAKIEAGTDPKDYTPAKLPEPMVTRPQSDDWLHVKVRMSYKKMRKYFGKRCPTYEKGCANCDAWHEWDGDRHVTVLIDNDTLVKQLMKGNL